MRDLSVVVENLRLVQRARRRFMELWAVEKDYIEPILNRMAEDLRRVTAAAAAREGNDPEFNPAPLSDDKD